MFGPKDLLMSYNVGSKEWEVLKKFTALLAFSARDHPKRRRPYGAPLPQSD